MNDIVVTMAEVFKALGDPTRLRIVKILASNTGHSLCVGALARKLGITQPAASQHLKVLKNVGLVVPNRDGFRVHYTVNRDMVETYKGNIDELFKLTFTNCPNSGNCQEEHHK